MHRILYIIIAIIGFSVLTAAVFMTSEFYASKWESERLVKEELTDTEGKSWNLAKLKDKFGIIYFGYTYCPDLCPTALNDLSIALKGMGNNENLFQPIFISIDPERDTPQIIREYIENFGQNLLGLTGTSSQLKSFTFNLGSTYTLRKNGASDEDYTVDHTIGYFMVNSTGHKLSIPIKNNTENLRNVIIEVKNRMLTDMVSE